MDALEYKKKQWETFLKVEPGKSTATSGLEPTNAEIVEKREQLNISKDPDDLRRAVAGKIVEAKSPSNPMPMTTRSSPWRSTVSSSSGVRWLRGGAGVRNVSQSCEPNKNAIGQPQPLPPPNRPHPRCYACHAHASACTAAG